jgi:hypothetical protein
MPKGIRRSSVVERCLDVFQARQSRDGALGIRTPTGCETLDHEPSVVA